MQAGRIGRRKGKLPCGFVLGGFFLRVGCRGTAIPLRIYFLSSYEIFEYRATAFTFFDKRKQNSRMRIEKLIEATKEVSGPRRSYGNLRHNLADIRVIGLCAILCKGEDFVLRKTALALLKEVDWGRIGLKKKMFIAALNPDKLLQVLFSKK